MLAAPGIYMTTETTTKRPFESKAEEFYLSEYASLRAEIELHLKYYNDLERNVVIAIGVVWSWLGTLSCPR